MEKPAKAGTTMFYVVVYRQLTLAANGIETNR